MKGGSSKMWDGMRSPKTCMGEMSGIIDSSSFFLFFFFAERRIGAWMKGHYYRSPRDSVQHCEEPFRSWLVSQSLPDVEVGKRTWGKTLIIVLDHNPCVCTIFLSLSLMIRKRYSQKKIPWGMNLNIQYLSILQISLTLSRLACN